MRRKNGKGGFSLIEVVVAIALLGLVVGPICGGLVLSFRLNARSEELMQAQLAVSSAAEALMAARISETYTNNSTLFEGVTITTVQESDQPYYTVTVTSTAVDSVSVTTYIRAAEPSGGDGG